MLTATLLPSEEDELFRRMHFNREQVKIFRARTTRTNVAYQFIKTAKALKKKEAEAVVLKAVRQKWRQYRSGKVVVYRNLVGKVKKLAEQLGCNAYYHDAVGKASMLADFIASKQRVIVATSALGIEVDIPNIQCIVHIN
jgi:superfamily II DNA helicase RecQ